MRVIADAIGLTSEDFYNNQIVDNSESIFEGYNTILVDDQTIDQFYEKEQVYLNKETLFPNQYVMMVSSSNSKKTALARYINKATPIQQVLKSQKIWGIKPRNKEQQFLMDALMDPKVQVVTVIGKAGSGKTICAIAAGLEQTIRRHQVRILSGNRLTTRTAAWKGHWLPPRNHGRENVSLVDAHPR